MANNKGQIILLLILVMTVALAVGLSIVQKSLTDISTATKVEQSQRAFSAAEAGIERALRVGQIGVGSTASLAIPETGARVDTAVSDLIPKVPTSVSRQAPLQYPPLAREEIAHVWLADFNSTSNPPATHYTQNSLDVYWGNSTADKTALELTLVYYDGSKYTTRKWFLDHEVIRTPANNFATAPCTGYTLANISYQCKKTIGTSPDQPLPSGLMILRARLIYNTTSQPFAVQAVGTCGKDCSIPPQAREFLSTGTVGESQRKIKIFQLEKVVPPYFDFAIFSAGEIRK